MHQIDKYKQANLYYLNLKFQLTENITQSHMLSSSIIEEFTSLPRRFAINSLWMNIDRPRRVEESRRAKRTEWKFRARSLPYLRKTPNRTPVIAPRAYRHSLSKLFQHTRTHAYIYMTALRRVESKIGCKDVDDARQTCSSTKRG